MLHVGWHGYPVCLISSQSTTEEAAKDMAAFVAIFFENFSQFKGRAFHMAGESYGVSPPKLRSQENQINVSSGSLHPRLCSRSVRSERQAGGGRIDTR